MQLLRNSVNSTKLLQSKVVKLQKCQDICRRTKS